MSIESKIKINTHYTRSVNLERDMDSSGVIKSYIPTSRALSTLNRIADTFGSKEMPRSWALVGPYGSGKSTFAVFLAHLLGGATDSNQKLANKVLKNTDANIAKKFALEAKGTDGYCHVLLTGSPEPLAKRFCENLYEAANEFWSQKRGRSPAIVAKLLKLTKKKEPKVSVIIEHIEELQYYVAKAGGKGVLVIFDELGKFLEYEARHHGTNDIFLLQALAEHAYAGSDANLYIFVLLHQTFDQYAKGLGESLKNEWSKVQGRFENIPFLESSEQVLRVVASAFEYDFSVKEVKRINHEVESMASVLHQQSALPSLMDADMAQDIFSRCYPLHPVSALLLPVLCQKVAQNERTLFSYLGSFESHGFKDSLSTLEEVGDWIYPWEIYDYFIHNQPAALSDHYTNRRWVEVVTAIERLGDASCETIQLLKTIGLLNIVGVQGGFKASKAIIELCLNNPKTISSVVKILEKKAVVQFRKFSGEYRVWQGSDFDLEMAVSDELAQLGQIELAQELNKRKSLSPIVARKYTIQKGSLRYFQPVFVDVTSYKSIAKSDSVPRIVFYLASSQDDLKSFKVKGPSLFNELDIVVLCQSSAQLSEIVTEVIALQRIQATKQELTTDPIAQREFSDRLSAAEHQEDLLLENLLEYPEEHIWFWSNEEFKVKGKRDLQSALSDVLETVFNKIPVIQNELINRDSPSSQAVGARNRLLLAMMEHEGEVDLGIEKFPPEKSIYRSVLRQLGLHKEVEKGQWAFVEPSKRSNVYHVWKRINAFLDSTEQGAKSFAELNKELMAPPYGVKAGVLPILYIAAYIVYQHELALYESKHYKPYFTFEMLERFVKRPDEFTFQRFKIAGMNESLFQKYSTVIHGDTKKRTLLELAQPLAKFMGQLPVYAQKTRRDISEQAHVVRTAFNLAKSPAQLLFNELPKAVGFDNFSEGASEKELERFSQSLTKVLRELRDAYGVLLDKQKVLLAQAFNLDSALPLDELRKVISGHCHGLEGYTVDTQGLKAFIMRLTKKTGNDKDWFENVLMFLGQKPSSKWDDTDQDKAEYRLSDFSRRVIDLEKIRLHEKDRSKKMSGDFDVYLLRSIKKGGDFHDEVVAVDKQSAERISATKEVIHQSLNELTDKELMLASLAEIVDEFLVDYRNSKKNSSASEKKYKPSKKVSKGDVV